MSNFPDPYGLLSCGLGLALLLAGATGAARGATAVGPRIGLPAGPCAVVVAAIAAILPALALAVDAARSDAADLAVGAAIGGGIAALLPVVGIAVIIVPAEAQRRRLVTTFAAPAAAAIGLTATACGGMTRPHGFILLAAAAAFIVLDAWRRRGAAQTPPPADDPLPVAAAFLLGGLFALLVGADLLLKGAIDLAARIGTSRDVVGLTAIGLGLAVPGLIAAVRKSGDALDRAAAAATLHPLAVTGAAAVLAPLAAPKKLLVFDVPMLLLAALLPLGLAAWRGRLGRKQGTGLLALYAVLALAQIFVWPRLATLP